MEVKTEVRRIDAIIKRLTRLRAGQLTAIEATIASFEIPVQVWINPDSDFATPEFGDAMADVLRAHHASSLESFTKDKTEYAMVRILGGLGHKAAKSPPTFPGNDITVDEVRFSLKTQADAAINENLLHVSKFMELGKGEWRNEADLAAQRDRMLAHMRNYERILDLRCLSRNRRIYRPGYFRYELVEIPKALLQRAADAVITMAVGSKQTSNNPGYGRVYDESGSLLFELYFDGGGERKLQIRSLAKSACIVHATWEWTDPA